PDPLRSTRWCPSCLPAHRSCSPPAWRCHVTSTPALRLVSPTLQADVGGISATPGPRQLVVDGEASLRLRKKIGNDSYSALEVLFILADVTPSGVVVHSATERLQDSLGWGRDKVRNTLKRLQDQGY